MAASSEFDSQFDYLFKIVLVGGTDTYIAEVQMVNCFINKDPNDDSCLHTIEHFDSVGTTTVEIDGKTIKAQVGVKNRKAFQRGKAIVDTYLCRNCHDVSGVMLVYDMMDHDDRESFLNVHYFFDEMRYHCPNDAVIVLLGTCTCTYSYWEQYNYEIKREFAAFKNYLFREVSTDNVEQVNEAFMTLIKGIYYAKHQSASKKEISPKPAKEIYYAKHQSASKKEISPKPAKESIFDRWFSTKKQTSNAIEKPSSHQKGASSANSESKQAQKETQLQSKSRSDSTPKMESKVLGSKENAPSYHNADEEIDLLSKTIDNLKQENRDQLAQHIRVNQQLQNLETDKHQLETDKHQLETDKQQLQQQVLQQQSEITTLRDQLKATSNRKDHDNSSDDSWKVSHREVTVTQQELGRGGWGVIWVGVFREQKAAVKQMHEAITCQVNLDLLHREVNTMAQLRHPNLLQFIGAVLDHPSGNPMIITEIMDTSLRKAYEDKSLTPSRDCLPVCVGIMHDVAVGLNYLHCLPDPIIHRDVSSANVLLESKGNGKWKTKISDFGSANKAKQAMTRAAGAAVYSAPESLQPVTITGTKRKLTTKMDVFSYGVLLCEVLNCRFPDIDSFSEMLQEMKKRYLSLHQLVCLCISEQAEERPVMKQVIKKLDHSY